ncbi:hypothetical protein FACS1894200_13880 [Spirochaetia bacterium]|nr:hypothetical protein FACS1894200_13880 [Spirochaetia bacterium]
MTPQQLEERKAERELMNHLRATRREIRKEQERMGLAAYDALKNREMVEDMENYCRKHPGYHIVQIGGGYLLKKIDGTTQP